jgi:hypothetical protein
MARPKSLSPFQVKAIRLPMELFRLTQVLAERERRVTGQNASFSLLVRKGLTVLLRDAGLCPSDNHQV